MVSLPTIFALSSGHPPAGLAVIRISGDRARFCVEALTGSPPPPPRKLVRVQIFQPNSDTGNTGDIVDLIDEAMVVWFPAPHSFTGQDCVEFHIHGGRAVIAALLSALGTLKDCRMAEPGEFTRRAYENGKFNLVQSEALADLIAARTEAQRRQALRQLAGGLGQVCQDWRERLKEALAHMEASIDFSDEDLPDTLSHVARLTLNAVREEISQAVRDGKRGECIRDGIMVAIIGPPNAGKSSLLNLLAQRDAAIVSRHAGTTRDIIEVQLDLGGFPVVLSDTAGICATDNEIEREGMRRARHVAQDADLCLVMFDGETWPVIDEDLMAFLSGPSIGLVNKVDLLDNGASLRLNHMDFLAVSVKTGVGIEAFMTALEHSLSEHYGNSEAGIITRLRHREALSCCGDHLKRALSVTGSELWAEDVRLAMRELGCIVGHVGVEDVLDVIFSEFCIGK